MGFHIWWLQVVELVVMLEIEVLVVVELEGLEKPQIQLLLTHLVH
tara:strand:- start:673 stop:807 length:135 start_codon:yes stop_codon:yes gene_type:complete